MLSSKSSNQWTLSEFLGQRRRLLGLGALLAWLVLFHLLVNVWLLCIFTSLLVVLGGWLGSRAILDANRLLHLEHFLPLGGGTPPLCSAEHEWRLNHEIHNAVHKAVRDFVSSWYRTLLPEVEGEFERAVRNSMLESVMELKERARQVDRKALVQRLLELYGCHLQSYMTARHVQQTRGKNVSLWQIYQEIERPHPAVSDAAAELSYARALVNLVLHVLVPYPQMETRTGGYMVTELITCNVLIPLISRVSDPDWLNQTIVDIFNRSRKPQEGALYQCQFHQDSWTTCQSFSDQASLASESSSDFRELSSPISEEDSSECSSLICSGKADTCHAGLLTPCKVNCCSLTSGQYSHLQVLSVDSLMQSDSEDDMTRRLCECGPSPNFCNSVNVKDDVDDFGCFAPLKNLGPKMTGPVDAHWPAGIAQEKSPVGSSRRLSLGPLNSDVPNKPASSVNIQNVHIAGIVSAKDQRGIGAHPLYTITFETAPCLERADLLQSLACHSVNRRYSEFLNLQTRLEENPEVKKFIKNVKGPKKMFPDLPFGNTDGEKVEARKGQLDTFLRQLSSIPETAMSEDMQEFLALNSEVCTYFERKPFGKSRIDKMMENALDTLKTAFPHPEVLSPTEDPEGDSDGRTMDSRKYMRLMFPSKVSPSLNTPDLHPKVTYSFSDGSPVLNGMSLSRLESFVQEQERLLNEPQGRGTAKQSDASTADKKTPGKTTDTAVADVALNILCLLMKDQWSWLCTENIQKTIRLLFGTFIERWLDVGVAHLTSAPCWVIYLQVLQEAVWPGGTLPAQPQPERSAAERGETKERCLECLTQLLPELITDLLGSEKYRLSLETTLESLQDHHINKHLLYCLCELLLDFLIPEWSDDSFQRSLMQSLSKDNPT
ncbi:sorting nexin-19a isoform X1 [Nerophis lumbriciformis]|uniref:sorting nexin-19a isoform X1 n=1 Tax=Nerophis lumbriciformis TaxID=546530 RepID=UPI002ADFA6DB|nr:sorting nexin-19-like isoform X1 [Nerophis lumbriciformis]XP_061818267.1 sorting nexin-19-like isoform X1 [Nerophis lumbriciformis]XP_061818268.1 sorting nexin-19-like isoform X1 [Nerophis lumbriciformis]